MARDAAPHAPVTLSFIVVLLVIAHHQLTVIVEERIEQCVVQAYSIGVGDVVAVAPLSTNVANSRMLTTVQISVKVAKVGLLLAD
jgi:hypothetical protein